MDLKTLLNTIDGKEQITIINHSDLKRLYRGEKLLVNNVPLCADVVGIHTTEGKIVIEITY